MKVVVLAQYFPPDKPGRIPEELANELSLRGHEVRIVTAFPHYNEGKIPAQIRQRFQHVESHGGIEVKRVPLFASHSRSAIGRVLNYLSFSASSRWSGSFVKDADVVYVHGTPATVAYAAHVWSKRYAVPFLFHVQDIWPESVTGSGFLPSSLTRFVDTVISRWLRRVYAAASAIVVIAPSAKDLLVGRGASEEMIRVVFNWAREEILDEQKPDNCASSGLSLLYAGNLGPLQDLETVLKAMVRVRDLPGLRLQIAGSGVLSSELKSLVQDLDLVDRVEFLGLLSPDEMIHVYSQADFQIIPLKRLDIFRGTIPSKFQAGLAHRVPVITTVQGDLTDLVATHSLGYVAEPEDEASLERAFREAHASSSAERLGLRARAGHFYEMNLTKYRAIDQIEGILESIRRLPRS